MTIPVSFELAKMLKEKGFTSVFTAFSNKYYNSLGEYKIVSYDVKIENNEYEAPTIAEVVMWFYEKHGVWIEVSCHTVLDEKDDDVDVFYFVIRKLKPVNILYSGDFVNSPTEAYEAAILYTLKNLIP